MDRHQRLPLSMVRLGCSPFFVGKWAGRNLHAERERAVGPNFAKAFLCVVCGLISTCTRHARTLRKSAGKKPRANTRPRQTRQKIKDKLTFDLCSAMENNRKLRDEVARYAESAHGEKNNDLHDKNPRRKGVSAFTALANFGSLYREACYRFFALYRIHQQLVRAFLCSV